MNPNPWNIAASFCFLITTLVFAEDLPHPTPLLSPEIPEEVDAPVDPEANEIAVFDDYSWRLFVALNWPAKTAVRGEPDKAKNIADFSDPNTMAVWETWKIDYELFQKGGIEPTEWSSPELSKPLQDQQLEPSRRQPIIRSFSNFRDFNQAGIGRFGGPLVAQNRTYVRFEIRLNQVEFNFIQEQELFRKSHLSAGRLPKLRFPNNSIAVKAAWKIIKEDELPAAQGRYYLRDVMVIDPVTQKCKVQKMGLVGLHIVQKIPTRPQWVWSSFEQIDNVPEFDTKPPPGRNFSFNDPNKTQRLNPPTALAPISKTNPPLENPAPMQVIRLKKIADSTIKTNQDYHALLAGTVWENYQLVLTQWPKFPQPEEENGAPFPGQFTGPDPMTNIANTTMETYFQKSAATSCMGCHDTARQTGTDFVWFLQLRDPGE
jgi:hypothetical protein